MMENVSRGVRIVELDKSQKPMERITCDAGNGRLFQGIRVWKCDKSYKTMVNVSRGVRILKLNKSQKPVERITCVASNGKLFQESQGLEA